MSKMNTTIRPWEKKDIWNHNSSQLPIAKVINICVEDGKIIATVVGERMSDIEKREFNQSLMSQLVG